MAKAEERRIAVIGAGPVGLEAALYARTLGLPTTLYERGRVGEYLHYWGHVRLFSPFGMNATTLGRTANCCRRCSRLATTRAARASTPPSSATS